MLRAILIHVLLTYLLTYEAVLPSSDWKSARGRPPTTWIHRQVTGLPVTDALKLAADTDRSGNKSQ